MAFYFHKNAIITGYIDSYCLVCETYLKDEEDVISHVVKPMHKKQLDSTPYMDKYRDHCIRKVKKGYYCGYCNILISTENKINLHVTESKHIENKDAQKVKRVNNIVVAFDNYTISDKAWNAMSENTCLVCNEEYENEDIHITLSTHILNLIKCKMQVSINKSIYRKFDDGTFQCLVCNLVFALKTIDSHFEHPDHKKNLQVCETNLLQNKEYNVQGLNVKVKNKAEIKNDVNKQNSGLVDKHEKESSTKKQAEKSSGNENKSVDKDEEICDDLAAKDYIIYTKEGDYLCVLCDYAMDNTFVHMHVQSEHHERLKKMHKERLQKQKSKNVASADTVTEENNKKEENKDSNENRDERKKKPNKKDVKETVPLQTVDKNHNKITAKPKTSSNSHKEDNKTSENNAKSSVTLQNDAQTFAKENGLTYNSNTNESLCHVCNVRIPSALRSMKEHVEGATHKSRITMQKCENLKLDLNKKETCEVKIIKKPTEDFIESFGMVEDMFFKDVIINDKFCINILSFVMISKQGSILRCQVCEQTISNMDEHRLIPKHSKAMSETPVITNVDDEFIREVRPNIFHCGFCNLIELTWENLQNHLKSTSHRESKTAANWRLHRYLPEIMMQRQHERTVRAVWANFLSQLHRRF